MSRSLKSSSLLLQFQSHSLNNLQTHLTCKRQPIADVRRTNVVFMCTERVPLFSLTIFNPERKMTYFVSTLDGVRGYTKPIAEARSLSRHRCRAHRRGRAGTCARLTRFCPGTRKLWTDRYRWYRLRIQRSTHRW